jgi:hypothetical protein
MSETRPVTFEVLAIKKMEGCGALLAVATVLVAVYDVEFIFTGCQIRRLPDGRRQAGPPRWRDSGEWVPCIGANEALISAMGAEINAAYEEKMACA